MGKDSNRRKRDDFEMSESAASRIVVNATGGTIGQERDHSGVKTPKEGVIEHVVKEAVRSIESETPINFRREGITIEVRNPMLIDSGNTVPQTQRMIANSIYKLSDEQDVIAVITSTGTAKLHETITAMPVMVETRKPSIFVVSEKSYDEPQTDAFRNMKKALISAYELRKMGIGGMHFLSFNRKLIDARWVYENNGRFDDVHKEPKDRYVAAFERDEIKFRNGNEAEYREIAARILKSSLNTDLDEKVGMFQVPGGVDRAYLEKNLKMLAEGSTAILLLTNHDLSVREDLHPVLETLAKEKPIFVTSPTAVLVQNKGDYNTSRKLYDIGVYAGTGSTYLDYAIARAAVGRGAETREWFLDYVARAELGNFHREVKADDLEQKLGLSYGNAIARARDMNRRITNWQKKVFEEDLLAAKRGEAQPLKIEGVAQASGAAPGHRGMETAAKNGNGRQKQTT